MLLAEWAKYVKFLTRVDCGLSCGDAAIAVKITLGKIIAASMVFAGGIFLAMAAGSVYSIKQNEQTANWVTHSEEVKNQIHAILATVEDMESADRGYVITGADEYLDTYEAAKNQIYGRLDTLEELVADNELQSRRVAQLKPLVIYKMDIVAEIIARRRQGGYAAAAAAFETGEPKGTGDAVRSLAAQMLATENDLQVQRREDNDRQTLFSLVTALGTSAVGLGVLTVAAFIIARQYRHRLQAQAQLAKKSAELQGVLDNAPLGIFLKDGQGRYLLLNAPMEPLLGAPPADCLGRTPAELFSADRAAVIESEDREVLADGRPHTIDLELRCGDDVVRSFRTHKFTLRDAEGKIYAIGGISEDVTERRRLDAKLRQALATAEAASRTKSQFLANMSHELRTPLNSIIGFSEILSDKLFGALNEKQQQYVGNILASGQHLLLLINDLLDLAKIEAGKMNLELAQANIAELTSEAATLVRGSAERKGVALEFTPVEAGLAAWLDGPRTKQIIYNLLSNAVKFTPVGGRVTLTAQKIADPRCPLWGGPRQGIPGEPLPGEWLQLTVADTGIGIAEKDLRRIFNEFEQVDASYSRQQEGTGLGLALATKLAQLHGGGVWAESPGRLNQGSKFHVLLPLAGPPQNLERRPENALPVVKKTARLSASTPPFPLPVAGNASRRPLVLVVEDEAAAGDLIKEYLTQGGYEVARATSGEEALRLAETLRPAVITLDILLPDAHGFDVLTRLKAAPATQHIPVVIISVTDDRQTGLSLGATEFFVKPVNAAKLLAALERVRASIQREIQRVLVVDDEPIARETIVAMLEPRGYAIQAAESGEEALRLITTAVPDVAIIDLTMPGMSGFDLVAHLRRDPATRELPICIYTAKDLSAAEMHWLHEQATVVTAKPFREQLLTELHRACCNSS